MAGGSEREKEEGRKGKWREAGRQKWKKEGRRDGKMEEGKEGRRKRAENTSQIALTALENIYFFFF